jgi:hypothetical protein
MLRNEFAMKKGRWTPFFHFTGGTLAHQKASMA